jgi:hypothetical protein
MRSSSRRFSNRSAPGVTTTSRSACSAGAAANAGGQLGRRVTGDHARQQQVQRVRLFEQARDLAVVAAGSGTAPGGAASAPPPSQAPPGGRGDHVRRCGRHHFLVTSSWGRAERPSALARRTSGSRGSRGRTSRQGSSLRTLGRWMRMRFIAHLLGRSPEEACNAGSPAFTRLSRDRRLTAPRRSGRGSGVSQRLGRSLDQSTSPRRTRSHRLEPGDQRQRGGVPLGRQLDHRISEWSRPPC